MSRPSSVEGVHLQCDQQYRRWSSYSVDFFGFVTRPCQYFFCILLWTPEHHSFLLEEQTQKLSTIMYGSLVNFLLLVF